MREPTAPISTVDAIATVERISDIRGDDEAAHALEDALRRAVLETIAIGSVSANEAERLAKIAVSTGEIEFSRWCA